MMRRRIGRPGLLGTMARTAVVAGTATAVTRGMSRASASKAQNQADAQAYRAEPTQPAAPSQDDLIAKLKQLSELRTAGVINDEEFAAAKARLLG